MLTLRDLPHPMARLGCPGGMLGCGKCTSAAWLGRKMLRRRRRLGLCQQSARAGKRTDVRQSPCAVSNTILLHRSSVVMCRRNRVSGRRAVISHARNKDTSGGGSVLHCRRKTVGFLRQQQAPTTHHRSSSVAHEVIPRAHSSVDAHARHRTRGRVHDRSLGPALPHLSRPNKLCPNIRLNLLYPR